MNVLKGLLLLKVNGFSETPTVGAAGPCDKDKEVKVTADELDALNSAQATKVKVTIKSSGDLSR